MAYDVRSLATLSTQARQFFTSSITGTVVKLWANTFTVIGKVIALADREHELRRARLAKQQFASTADDYAWLRRHGFELGLAPNPGNQAVGNISVPAPDGTITLAGMTWVRGDGVTYSSLAPATSVGGLAHVSLQADLAAAASNMQPGDTLTAVLTDAVPQALGTTGTVDAYGVTGGTDPEDIEGFRARVLYRKRNPPQGGSIPDYVKWVGEALSAVGYDGDGIQVYVDSFQNDARSVWVSFKVLDQPNGIPSAGEVATAQAYVDDPIRRPVTARVFVMPPVEVDVPITITNFYPDTPDTRAAVTAELAALQADEIEPARPSMPFVLYREEIDAAIKRAPGVGHFTLVSPATDLTYATAAQMPVLQPPTYV